MKKAEEILLNTARCTITEDADIDDNQNFYVKWNDVLLAMEKYAKQYHNHKLSEHQSKDEASTELEDKA